MFPPKKSGLKVGLVLGDTQAGSRLSPIPPDFELPSIAWKPTQAQLYLWEKWCNMMDVLPKQLDFFFHLGEALQGPECQRHPTYELLTSDKVEQAEIAEALLGPIVDRVKRHSSGKGKAWWIFRSSSWHEGPYGREADALAKSLGAQKFPSGEPSGEILDLPIGVFNTNWAHHHPVFLQYRASALEREQKWLKESVPQAETEDGTILESYDLVGRAHVHMYNRVETPMGTAFTCPGWQLQQRYTVTKNVARSFPQYIGAVLVYLSDEEKEKGWRGIWLEPILYEHPRRKAATL